MKIFKVLAAALLAAFMFSALPLVKSYADDQVTIKMTASLVKEVKDGGKLTFEGGWNPRKITVNQGQDVTLEITATDADHEFAMEDLGIDVYIPSGTTQTVHFKASKAGNYLFHCAYKCGPDHKKMVGMLVVEPKQ